MTKKIILIGILIISINMLTGCFNSEKKAIEKRAISYFTEKYNINKKDIKVTHNNLYEKDKMCLDDCGSNILKIRYKGNEYEIKYNPYAEYFGDNYQYETISEDLLSYLKTRYSYAKSISVDLLEADVEQVSIKYEGDIVEYYAQMKEFDQNHKYLEGPTGLEARRLYTWVHVWIEAKSPEEAKRLHDMYAKTITTDLNNLGVNYNLTISNSATDNEYTAYYHYHVYDDHCYLTNKVDNRQGTCLR